ncbi:MAG: hypothetical protein R3320_05610 [Nitriliruptorales bacterium]|nr:hypothetical protein [Nitriliruptorales bacterium]
MSVVSRRTPAAGVAAWVLYAVALGLLAGTAVISTMSGDTVANMLQRETTPAQDIVWSLSWVGFGLVGALIVGRRPTNRIGWMLVSITFGLYLMLFLHSYAIHGRLIEPLPLTSAALWLAKWTMVPVLAAIVSMVLLFPSDEVSGRRRLFLRVVLGLFAAQSLLIALEPKPLDAHPALMNPLGVGAGSVFMETAPTVLGFFIAGVFLLTVADAIVRYRRAEGIVRQQYRWFVLAIAMFPLLFVAALLVQATPWWQPGDFDTVAIAFVLGLNGISVAIGIAVTRYRLFEIDRAISRTVVYAILSGVLVGLYTASVLGLGAVVRGLGGESNDLVVAASTLAVAAAFQPARRRIRTIVDRRFNRQRYDGMRAVDTFSNRLRNEVDLTAIEAELRWAVVTTIQPSTVAVWTRPA